MKRSEVSAPVNSIQINCIDLLLLLITEQLPDRSHCWRTTTRAYRIFRRPHRHLRGVGKNVLCRLQKHLFLTQAPWPQPCPGPGPDRLHLPLTRRPSRFPAWQEPRPTGCSSAPPHPHPGGPHPRQSPSPPGEAAPAGRPPTPSSGGAARGQRGRAAGGSTPPHSPRGWGCHTAGGPPASPPWRRPLPPAGCPRSRRLRKRPMRRARLRPKQREADATWRYVTGQPTPARARAVPSGAHLRAGRGRRCCQGVHVSARPCLQTPRVAAGVTNHGEEVELFSPITEGGTRWGRGRACQWRLP